MMDPVVYMARLWTRCGRDYFSAALGILKYIWVLPTLAGDTVNELHTEATIGSNLKTESQLYCCHETSEQRTNGLRRSILNPEAKAWLYMELNQI